MPSAATPSKRRRVDPPAAHPDASAADRASDPKPVKSKKSETQDKDKNRAKPIEVTVKEDESNTKLMKKMKKGKKEKKEKKQKEGIRAKKTKREDSREATDLAGIAAAASDDGSVADGAVGNAAAATKSEAEAPKRKHKKVGADAELRSPKKHRKEGHFAEDLKLPDGQTVLAPPSRGSQPKAKTSRVKKKIKPRADGKLPCREYEETGACKFGDKCKFSHLGKGAPVPKRQEGAARKKRNATCLAFTAGECKWGDRCRYRHVTALAPAQKAKVDEDRQIALALQGGDSQEEKLKRIMALPEALRQKARAIFFAKQRTGGFAAPKHLANGAEVVAQAEAVTKGACFAFLRGSCTRGASCIFRHGDDGTGAAAAAAKANWRAYREKGAEQPEETAP